MNPIRLQPRAYLTFIMSLLLLETMLIAFRNALIFYLDLLLYFKNYLFSTGGCWLNASVKESCALFWQVAAIFPLSFLLAALLSCLMGMG